jgi:hypothetical protein
VEGGSVVHSDLARVLNYLKGLPHDGVLCIPLILSDATAYWARKKVFWGGHSYGFHRLLKPYFPIMRKDVPRTLEEKSLNYVLFGGWYLDSLRDVGLEEGEHVRRIYSCGKYELYEAISKEKEGRN